MVRGHEPSEASFLNDHAGIDVLRGALADEENPRLRTKAAFLLRHLLEESTWDWKVRELSRCVGRADVSNHVSELWRLSTPSRREKPPCQSDGSRTVPACALAVRDTG